MKTPKDRFIFIGKKIKEARELMGWFQKELAEAVGFETSTAISLIEAGERRVAINDLEKIADVLHQNLKYFLGEDEKTNFRFALRANKDLSQKDKERILDFIDFIKSKRNERRRN